MIVSESSCKVGDVDVRGQEWSHTLQNISRLVN